MAVTMVISSTPIPHSSLPRNQSADHTLGLSPISVHPIHKMFSQSLSQHPILFAAGWQDWKQGLTRLPTQSPGTEGTVEKQGSADSLATACQGAIQYSAKVTEDTRCPGSCLNHWELSTWLKPFQSRPQKQTTGRRAKVGRERKT